MDRERLLKTIFIISLIYFLWIATITGVRYFFHRNIYLSFPTWCIGGTVLYAAIIIFEILIYFTSQEKEEEIKIVSEAITKVVCGNCNTIFTIKDTGVRPLKYKCPNCGFEGVLRGKSARGKILQVECDKCGNKFEIFDTGIRPLKYKCPVCHYEGVLS